MPVSLPYLNSYKNVGVLFEKIAAAKAPEAFTTRYLSETLGLKGSADRGLIGLLKSLGFLDPGGKPTAEYMLLKNKDAAEQAIARGIQRAYAPLFAANDAAQTLDAEAIRGLVSQVSGADQAMVSKIGYTFGALVKVADFSTKGTGEEPKAPPEDVKAVKESAKEHPQGKRLESQFHFNIQVHLPNNGTEETYLHIFNALRKTFE